MITLGQASNYRAGQVFRHLFAWGTRKDSEGLKKSLAVKYSAQPENVALYHTGRSALTVALRSAAGGRACNVILPGLTCIAVVRAIRAAGCTSVFVDIEPETLEYNYQKLDQKLAELAQKRHENPQTSAGLAQNSPKNHQERANLAKNNLKNPQNLSENSENPPKTIKTIDKSAKVCYNKSIILVQNTLGLSWNVSKIEQIAQKYDAVIVEDLAHSAGRIYPDGREVGTVGVATALSFGKGKAIDTIAGGAVILRNHQSADQPAKKPKLSDRLRDRWYPLFGLISRHTGKLGCYFMGFLVKIHFVQRSADAELDTNTRLTHWQAKLARAQLINLPSTPLRTYKLVQNRSKLLQEFQQNGYNLSEIWYDTPVSPARYEDEANFPASECPETVKISQQIINFPAWYSEDRLKAAHDLARNYEIPRHQATRDLAEDSRASHHQASSCQDKTSTNSSRKERSHA